MAKQFEGTLFDMQVWAQAMMMRNMVGSILGRLLHG